MNKKTKNNTMPVVIAGAVIVLAIMVLGTMFMGRAARQDAVKAVRSVSLLYLDELAGRRAQVVVDNLKDREEVIDIALGMITETDFDSLDHMRDYQRRIKKLMTLERFAFVDEDNLVYTADEGIQDDIDQYSFDPASLTGPDISVKNLKSDDMKAVIAVPIAERGLAIEGKKLIVCYMEMDMDELLEGASMSSRSTDATFANIYTKDGTALSKTILGGLAIEDNLLEALSHAVYENGYSAENVVRDFSEGKKGVVSFTYDDIQETLSYVPIEGTDWFLTYLIRESVVSDRINSIFDGMIRRSLLQSILTALVLAAIFAFLIAQTRNNARLVLEKETADTENRIRNQELEQRIALQEELLAQKAAQERQNQMISALASDYRSVYYLDLDNDHGICYQARSDIAGFREGDEFPYVEAVTNYCNTYVMEEYREDFLRFIQPDAVRAALKKSPVISFLYRICIDGKESYEAVRFATFRHREDADDQTVHSVGACFADVDADTRRSIEQREVLNEALSEAEQASRAKTIFLSNMSHEIRTPMNAIIGLNNIALNEPGVPEKVQGYLKKMGDSAQHLLGIINDILDMSRIESGRMVIKDEEFCFSKNLEQVNTIISGQCRDKGLHYECRTIGKIDDYYVGDGIKLKQVMINILSNAVKFTPEGGSVTFLIEEGAVFDDKATLHLTISDTGIGMSKEYLPHLFDAFSQEDSSSTNKYGSTGLGMPITKSIVELMNGHIKVKSEKGVGTTFFVSVTLGLSSRDHTAFSEGEIHPHDMNVLVIDDDTIALENAQIVLRQIGISCETAISGEESIEMVKMRHARMEDYDLILVDWKMPGMDGVETTRQIRQIVGNDTPIIILTSYNWDDVADEAKAAGVDTFVAKPLFAGSVLDEFRAAFKEKNAAMAARRADLKGRRVLLAEDVPVNAEIMIMVLSMREIEADLAGNGRIAVEMFTEHPAGYYDAILMDMRMPEMDGLEATRTIRASGKEDAETIPIIALTANAFDEDVQRSMQAGLNAHLSKPVEPEALFSTLESLIPE